MYTYAIDIEGVNYVAKLIVGDGKVVWEKDENGVIFRKRLDGKFSLNRSHNEPLFYRLLSFLYCDKGILSVYDNNGLVIQSSFRKKHLTISEDKCRVDIKFDKIDEYSCLDKIADKEFNILANYDGKPAMPIYSAKLIFRETLEYVEGTGNADLLINFNNGYWADTVGVIGQNNILYPFPSPTYFPAGFGDQGSWTFFSNTYEIQGAYSAVNTNNFNITTKWVREVKKIQRIGDVQTEPPPNVGTPCDFYTWAFSYEQAIGGKTYDIFSRPLEELGVSVDTNTPFYNFTLTNALTCNGAEYTFGRCRKLNDIITTMIYDCFPTGFKSEFFKSTVNPISGRDLSNLMLSQKSDCIFSVPEGETEYVVPVDPATKGNITFKNLMLYLFNEFQVYWAIDGNGDFRIEHKKYWDNNGSYTVPNTVDIDLTIMYPSALNGSNEYGFEQNIPIRETFSFMESWNIDFTGLPISYEDCVDTGEDLSYVIAQFTTDIDINFLFSVASKEGFCMFHCNSVAEDDGTYLIVNEMGALSDVENKNAHLSIANLQDSYWKYGRYLPQGQMNAELTTFESRALKYQIPVSFPYCVANFNPQSLIVTELGNGMVRSASFSFRTNFITVELEYTDIGGGSYLLDENLLPILDESGNFILLEN